MPSETRQHSSRMRTTHFWWPPLVVSTSGRDGVGTEENKFVSSNMSNGHMGTPHEQNDRPVKTLPSRKPRLRMVNYIQFNNMSGYEVLTCRKCSFLVVQPNFCALCTCYVQHAGGFNRINAQFRDFTHRIRILLHP